METKTFKTPKNGNSGLTNGTTIVPDEEDPHAILTVFDRSDAVVSRTRVAPDFKLSAESARKWLKSEGANG